MLKDHPQRLLGRFRAEITEVRDPRSGKGEVRPRVLVAGACGTDVELHRGRFALVCSLTPGHEIVGVVDEVGPGCVSLEMGQRVGLDDQVPGAEPWTRITPCSTAAGSDMVSGHPPGPRPLEDS